MCECPFFCFVCVLVLSARWLHLQLQLPATLHPQVAHSHRFRCWGSGESGNMGRSKPNLRTRHACHSWSGSYTVMLSFQPGLYDLLRTFHGFEKRTHAAHIETLSREWLSANYSIHNTGEEIHYSSHGLALTIVLGQFAWNRKCSARSGVLQGHVVSCDLSKKSKKWDEGWQSNDRYGGPTTWKDLN